MMTKTQFFCFAALFFITCSLFPTSVFAQVPSCTLEEKYWGYRKRLNDNFVRVDRNSVADGYHDTDGIGEPVKNADGSYAMPIRFTKNGYSTPMDAYDPGTNRLLSTGDNTITLGNYLKTLALEYKLLKNAGDNVNAKKTLDEIFLAQQALRRLDKSANLFLLEESRKQSLDTMHWQTTRDSVDANGNIVLDINGNSIPVSYTATMKTFPACDSIKMNTNIDTSGFSGFFYRSDAVWFDTHIGTASHTGQSGFWSMESAYHSEDGGKFNPKNKKALNFVSQDQIFGLINGLAMVKRMIEPAKTDEEKKVLDNANKQLVGLIVQGLNIIKLKGCFDGGHLQGNGAEMMHRNELMRVASDLGLLPSVIIADPSFSSITFSLFSDTQPLEKLLLGGCVPQNSFQPNHYMRLNTIAPAKIGYIPNVNTAPLFYRPEDRKEGLLFLNDVALDTHKPSFALESIVFNPSIDSSTRQKITSTHCNKMKTMLDNAPCCGPCINCAARPASLFEKVPKMCRPNGDEIKNLPNTSLNNIKENWTHFLPVVGIGFVIKDAIVDHNAQPCRDANGNIRYESYQYIKPETFDLGWFTDDSNATTFPCDRNRYREYVWGTDETYFNGLDFMQDFMLWSMTCGSSSEDERPKLTQPNPLEQVGGCENVGKVHIQGPDVVCKGEKVDFNISTEGVHTPIDGNAHWSLGGNIIKGKSNNPTPDQDVPQFMNKTGVTFPNSIGSQTISYQFSAGGQTKTITKTVNVIDKPNAPTITNMQVNQERCVFTVELGNLGNNSLSAPSGSVAGNSVNFVMGSEPYTATVYTINRCGVSEATTIEIPAASIPCRIEPRIVKNNSTGINPNEITLWSNPVSKTITVKCDVLYNAPFETRLYDLTGRLVHTQYFETIDITVDYSNQNLQSGLYIFALYSGFEFLKSSKFYLENY